MARTISKKVASATIFGFDANKEFELDSDTNMPKPNVVITTSGNPSDNKARLLLEKHCGHKNVMVVSISVDETKLTVLPEVFYANSLICEANKTYDRNYVTQLFKVTAIGGFYIDESGMHEFSTTYQDVTTDSKLLNYVRDIFDTQKVTITCKEIVEEKRYMLRSEYLELAK